jgi:type IV secretory pathway VirB10-like protein
MNRLLIAAAGIAAAVVLFVVLRPGDDDSSSPPPPPAPPTTSTRETGTRSVPPPPTTPQPPPPPTVVQVPIVIRAGRPVGGIRRVTVARNRNVVLVVRSDVADHVHLHGYDVMSDVGPGAPGRLRFRATIPGRFEVELEDRGLQIADVTVKP